MLIEKKSCSTNFPEHLSFKIYAKKKYLKINTINLRKSLLRLRIKDFSIINRLSGMSCVIGRIHLKHTDLVEMLFFDIQRYQPNDEKTHTPFRLEQ